MREDDDKGASWEDRVARNYESKLFREYALVSLPYPRMLSSSSPILQALLLGSERHGEMLRAEGSCGGDSYGGGSLADTRST